jgi:hypothetical protein
MQVLEYHVIVRMQVLEYHGFVVAVKSSLQPWTVRMQVLEYHVITVAVPISFFSLDSFVFT